MRHPGSYRRSRTGSSRFGRRITCSAHPRPRSGFLGEHDQGWHETGDLGVPDGRGGIQLVGWAADQIRVFSLRNGAELHPSNSE